MHRDNALNDSQSISIAVLSGSQDDVELVNRTMRDAGSAAHCHWAAAPAALDDTLSDRDIELLVVNVDSYPDTIRQVVKQKDTYSPELPVVAIGQSVTEEDILEAMNEEAELAARYLGSAAVDAVAYACTSGSFIGGPGYDQAPLRWPSRI